MAKKNTLRANKPREPKVYIYEIGVRKGDQIMTFIIEATRVDSDVDSLHVYDWIDNEEVKTGEFNDWVYFFQRAELSKEELEKIALQMDKAANKNPPGA